MLVVKSRDIIELDWPSTYPPWQRYPIREWQDPLATWRTFGGVVAVGPAAKEEAEGPPSADGPPAPNVGGVALAENMPPDGAGDMGIPTGLGAAGAPKRLGMAGAPAAPGAAAPPKALPSPGTAGAPGAAAPGDMNPGAAAAGLAP